MYKYDNGQISIDEFGQPVDMKLHAENRWAKKAMIIPWGAIEHRYAALFTNDSSMMVYFRKTPHCSMRQAG